MRITLLALLILGTATPTQAQDLFYKIKFKGKCYGTDVFGEAFTDKINNKTLIREWAGRVGETNLGDLALVFRPDTNDRHDDVIEIINKKTGAPVVAVFPLAFQEPVSVATSRRITENRFAYVYNIFHSEVSRGTAVVKEQVWISNSGNTNRVALKGRMQWHEVPDAVTNTLRICKGTFRIVGKPLEFNSASE